MDDQLTIPFRDAAHMLGVSPSTLYRAVKSGVGPRVTKIGGKTFVLKNEFSEFLEKWTSESLPSQKKTSEIDGN